MKFVAKVLLAVALSTVGAFATQDATLSKEDEAFWGRFLEGDGSIPTAPPVIPPTAPPVIPPTPPPTFAPTAEPVEPCFVEVDITCVAEDGTECVDLVPPPVPTEEDCIVNICYTIVITNTGAVCMDITVADLDVNGEVTSVLDLVPINPLCPEDGSTSFETCGDIDICNGGEFCAIINVEADPPNGDICLDDAEYKFTGMHYIVQWKRVLLHRVVESIGLPLSSSVFTSIQCLLPALLQLRCHALSISRPSARLPATPASQAKIVKPLCWVSNPARTVLLVLQCSTMVVDVNRVTILKS